jgi:hypothetical protein
MSTLDGDGSGRYLCVPYPDALVKAWADPLRKAGVAVMPGIEGWPDVWPVAGRDDAWFDTAVATTKKFGFSGYSLDIEPIVQPPSSGEAYMAEYTQSMGTFSTRLAACGLRVAVAEPNGNLLNYSTIPVGNEPNRILNTPCFEGIGDSGAEVATMDTIPTTACR